MESKKTTSETADITNKPLALHIRRLRQWYDGKRSLHQGELAHLTGVSRRQLCRYEASRDLPHEIAALLRIALALRVPVETLVSDEWLANESAEIEERRKHMGLGEYDDVPGDINAYASHE